MPQYILYPRFSDFEAFNLNMLQAAYYLAAHLKSGSRVYFEADSDLAVGVAPDFYDRETKKYYDRYSDQFTSTDLTNLADDESHDDPIILCWDSRVLSEARAFARDLGKNVPVIRIDRDREQYAASFYLKLTSNDGLGDASTITDNKERLHDLIDRMRDKHTAIFGTGPTLEDVDLETFENCNVIVTNSMVKRFAFIKKTRPVAIIASDPIFHAGCSQYAAKFRKMLVRAMDATDAYFVHPMRDVGVYTHVLPPRLHDRMIAVPVLPADAPNLELDRRYWVKAVPNVMTQFLLPLSATVSKRIYMAGFDGRPREDNSYFWPHSAKDQINEEMDSIRDAHPSFFNVSYSDYYEGHIKDVEVYLDAVERKGVECISLTPSYVPAVAARYQSSPVPEGQDSPTVSVIVPCFDAEDTIDATIQSILGQSFADLELLAVNDGSTDGTQAILERWALMDSRVRILTKENGGVSSARNLGIDAARGRYICFCDADDVLPYRSVEARVQRAEEGDASAVFGGYEMIDQRGRMLEVASRATREVDFHRMVTCPLHINAIMVRSNVLKRRRFREGMTNGEDWLFLVEAARSGVKFVPVDEPVMQYRWRVGSATKNNMLKHILSLSEVYAELERDNFLDPDMPLENRCGVSSVDVKREQVNRLYSAAAEAVLSGNVEAAEQLRQLIETKKASVKTPLKPVDPGMIERQAVRRFLVPLGSDTLHSKLSSQSQMILRALEPFHRSGAHLSFVQAFRDVLNKAQGSQEFTLDTLNAPAKQQNNAPEDPVSTSPAAPGKPQQASKPIPKPQQAPVTQVAAPAADPAAPPRPWRPRYRTYIIAFIALILLTGAVAAAVLQPNLLTVVTAATLAGMIAGYALQVCRAILAAR